MNVQKYFRAGMIEIYSLKAFIAEFYTSLLYYPAELIILYFIWKLIYTAIGASTIGGFSFSMLISYFILQRILSRFLSIGKPARELDDLINSGNLVIYLARPLNYVVFKISQVLFLSSVQTVLGVASFLVVGFFLNLSISFEGADWLAFFPLVAMSLVIIFLLDFLIGILAFWLGRLEHVRIVYSLLLRLVSGALVPISFFPESVQFVLELLPFQYMFYTPIGVIVGAVDVTAKTYIIPAVWVVLLAVLLKVGWSRGLKRFEVQGG